MTTDLEALTKFADVSGIRSLLIMSQSWYVENKCVDVESLQPISLIFIGVVIQVMISAFILSTSNDADNTDLAVPFAGSSESNIPANVNFKSKMVLCLKRLAGSKFARWTKFVLLIWQFISVIMIFILDILKMANKVPQFDSKRNRYQCLSSILLTSSNTKTFFSYAFVGMSGPASSEVHFRLKQMFPRSSRSKYVFIVFCCCLGILEMATIMPYFVGILVYCWIPLAAEFIVGASILLAMGLLMIVPSFRSMIMNRLISNESKYRKFTDWISIHAAGLFVTCCVSVFGLAMVNLYSGMTYWDSWSTVFTERHWVDYMKHVRMDAEECFRFVTWIL